MCYALSFILLFTIGGLTGLFLGALATDVHLHDTYFVVAHFHYVMMGGTLIAFLGGLHYWWPKMFGRMFSELWGRIACLVIFAGFNMTFFPQFILGTQGMPRRYARYEPDFQWLHQDVDDRLDGPRTGFLVVAAIALIHSLDPRPTSGGKPVGRCHAWSGPATRRRHRRTSRKFPRPPIPTNTTPL